MIKETKAPRHERLCITAWVYCITKHSLINPRQKPRRVCITTVVIVITIVRMHFVPYVAVVDLDTSDCTTVVQGAESGHNTFPNFVSLNP